MEDLNRYYVAMDWAVMNFHKERMRNINAIIRDLWRRVYTGNDIDTIEIKAEADVKPSGKYLLIIFLVP
jgi:DNA repair protein RAD50